jgi:hypothetical protein
VLGLVEGELTITLENVAPLQPFIDIWAPGLLVMLKLLTLRSLQEWKDKAYTYSQQEIKTIYNHLKKYSSAQLFKNKNFNFLINCILDLKNLYSAQNY